MCKWLLAGILLAAVSETGCRTTPRTVEIRVRPEARAASGPQADATREETSAELHGRANDLLRAGNYSKALELYDRVLASRPRDANALVNKAIALSFSNRKAEAGACLQQAIDAGFTDLGRLARLLETLKLRHDEAFDAVLREYDVVLAEDRAPALENVERLLAEPRLHPFLVHVLPRYRSSQLTGGTLSLLESSEPRLKRAAVISLLHQNANEATTRATIAGLTSSQSAEIREAVAEYFLWHGREEDRGAIAEAAMNERDPFALAAERVALKLIATRAGWAGLPSPSGDETRRPQATSCGELLELLKANPTVERLRQVGDAYRSGWDLEPRLVYQGPDVDAKALAERRACFALDALIFRFMSTPPGRREKGSGAMPVAVSFMAPVRDYFDPSRRSFGGRTGNAGPFKNSVHVGDDVAWYADEGTVVAIADGIVRHVSHSYSWGFIVVIEHRLPKRQGFYCSLYAHLASSITVGTGEVVRKGQRIASVGRSFTWENGGYPAHVHFGIHRGPYLQRRPYVDAGAFVMDDMSSPTQGRPNARWVTGYVGPERWADGDHGWVDPQPFITDRLEGTAASGTARR